MGMWTEFRWLKEESIFDDFITDKVEALRDWLVWNSNFVDDDEEWERFTTLGDFLKELLPLSEVERRQQVVESPHLTYQAIVFIYGWAQELTAGTSITGFKGYDSRPNEKALTQATEKTPIIKFLFQERPILECAFKSTVDEGFWISWLNPSEVQQVSSVFQEYFGPEEWTNDWGFRSYKQALSHAIDNETGLIIRQDW